MSSTSKQVSFQPFRCLPLLERHHSWRSRRLLYLLPLLFAAAIAASALEGTLGSATDFTPLDDFRRVFRVGNPEPSVPRFPFTRDYPSWFLATVIVLTCVLVHRQWSLMHECLPKLVSNRVLVPHKEPAWGSLQRFLGMKRLFDRHIELSARTAATPFDVFVTAMNKSWLEVIARANVLIFGAAVLIVGLVVLNIQHNGLFEVLAPPGQDPRSRAVWLARTYDSWWAATTHVFGISVYAGAATLGVFVVLLQNAVGVACVYLAVAMPALVTCRADWDGADECYGWSPLSYMYRTVYWSLMLHGATLSILLVVLGGGNFRWLGILVLMWAAVIPLYTVVPWLVFRSVRRQAIQERAQEIDEGLRNDLARADLSDTQKREVRRIAREDKKAMTAARIAPLRLPRPQIPAFVVTVLFPIVLAVFQIWFAFQFGPN